MSTNPRLKYPKGTAQKNLQIKQKENLKSPENNKLIGKKRKRAKNISTENNEESNETYTETRDTIITRKSNAIIGEIMKNNDSAFPKDKTYLKRSLPPHKTALRSSFSKANKKEKFIKIKNANKKESLMKKQQNNIKFVSFQNEQSKSNRRRRRNRRNKKYFFKRKNLRRKGERENSSEDQNNVSIPEQLQRMAKKIEKMSQEFNDRINQQASEIIKLKKTIKNQNNKLAILSEINNQSEISSIKMKDYLLNLGRQFNELLNCCKIMFARKICNFILDGIINKYPRSLALTKCEFINAKGNQFKLIVFKKDIQETSKYHLNLIIDFLMETKQNTSGKIHINDIDFPALKEIFFILFDKVPVADEMEGNDKNISNDAHFQINIQEMVDLIFKKKNKKNLEFEEIKEQNEEEEEEEEEEEKEEREEKSNELNDDDAELMDYDKYIKKYPNIKKLLSGKNNNNVSIKNLRETLEKKIKNNQEENKILALRGNEIIDKTHLYKSWKESFEKEGYKKQPNYKIFIKKDYIQSRTEMKNLILKLLPTYHINLFSDDPSNFSKRIKAQISGY